MYVPCSFSDHFTHSATVNSFIENSAGSTSLKSVALLTEEDFRRLVDEARGAKMVVVGVSKQGCSEATLGFIAKSLRDAGAAVVFFPYYAIDQQNAEDFLGVLKGSKDLMTSLSHPNIRREQRKAIINEVLSSSPYDHVFANFVFK